MAGTAKPATPNTAAARVALRIKVPITRGSKRRSSSPRLELFLLGSEAIKIRWKLMQEMCPLCRTLRATTSMWSCERGSGVPPHRDDVAACVHGVAHQPVHLRFGIDRQAEPAAVHRHVDLARDVT